MVVDRSSPGKRKISAAIAWLFDNQLLVFLAIFYAVFLILDVKHEPLFCDESSFLKNICGFVVYRTVEPIYTNYPTFFSYLLAVPIYIGYFICYFFIHHFPWDGLLDARLFALVFQGEIDVWLWIGRMVSIICSVGILAIVYRYCIIYSNRLVAICAALLLIFSPYSFYMLYARYALPDILIAFLVTSILFMLSIYIDQPDDKRLYFTGFLAGIAASAKLNGLLAIAPVLALPWIVRVAMSKKIRLMSLTVVWAMFGFFVGSPCNVLKPSIYASGFGLESQFLYSHANSFDFQWLIPALWREEPVMTALIIVAVIFSLWRHSKRDMIFHAICIPSVIFLGGLSKHTPYYLLFLIPWLCTIIGELFQKILTSDRIILLRWVAIAGLVGTMVYEGHRFADRIIQDNKPDNRDIAREWIKNNIPSEHILLDVDYVPRLGFSDLAVMSLDEYVNKNKYPAIVKQYAQREFSFYFAHLFTFHVSIEELKEQGWTYFVTSNYCLEHYLQDPAKMNVMEGISNVYFSEYLQHRAFYLQLVKESIDVKVFRDGSGPKIYIFRLL